MDLQKIDITASFIKNTALTALFIFALSACSTDTSKEPPQPTTKEGFTFFDIGSNSLLTNQVRKQLEGRLGSEAIERRTTIDLSIHSPDFLKNYFPHLHDLNKKLNWPPRERVEHNVTKLMYRYADKNKLPFSKVELFFSDYTTNPLFFRIHAGPKGEPILQTLKKKYGPSVEIQWSQHNGKTFFWQKQKDVLTVSLSRNRYDRPEYLFCIFYVDNLEGLLEKERIERKVREEKIKDAGKIAF